MSNLNLSVDTENLGPASQNQRRPRHGKVVVSSISKALKHAQFIAFYDTSQPSLNDIPVFWQGSRDRGSLKFRFRTRDGGSICILLDDGNYEVHTSLFSATPY
ncbi:hypothetical protein E3Q23_01732 [Wallemia mellicola]|uniref:Uncharacterized protein n=1 Tax=Wallemia mellicola TaxID=1708541 RepID=A0A4T0M1Z2_9BASI|nr:hypothetical protein E3Q23_01732 [Wallemia mellicola]TIC65816.1 hypothetical protein E3Q01_01943 [Wallemia mellicola]TIC67060.1 hypothetical protein E3Q03_02038 [Wallemia mellicola]